MIELRTATRHEQADVLHRGVQSATTRVLLTRLQFLVKKGTNNLYAFYPTLSL